MGANARCSRNSDRVTIGNLSSEYISVPPDSNPLPHEFLWRKQMGKESDLSFTVLVGTYFCNVEEHEPLIIALLIPVISRRKWRGPWTIKVREWESGTAWGFCTELYRGQES